MDITINEKTVTLKKSFRSVIAFEQAMKKSFNLENLTDTIMYFYCTILSSDQELVITFDDFLAYIDENPNAITEFTQWLVKQNEMESKLSKKKTPKKTK